MELTAEEISEFLNKPQRIHVIGAAGAGMAALANIFLALGHRVTGSDLKGSSATDSLNSLGADIKIGHDEAHIVGADAVLYSNAVKPENPELAYAIRQNLPALRRTSLMTALTKRKKTLAVSGTHGKTTTTSMLSLILSEVGAKPSFLVGGSSDAASTGSSWSDASEWFVVEADESDNTFNKISRTGSIATNIGPDHLETYGGWEGYKQAFVDFVVDTSGLSVACADDPVCRELYGDMSVVWYGKSEIADFQLKSVQRTGRSSQEFVVKADGKESHVKLGVAGEHNALNAVGAIALATSLGFDFEECCAAVQKFAGVGRRFTYRGEPFGITLVDDYAHLPAEVTSALSIARGGGWDRIVAVLQPHRYSRISTMAGDFADCFDGVDLVVVTDVYHAHETPIPGVTGELVVNAIRAKHPDLLVQYTPTKSDAVEFLVRELRAGDVCVTLGCGDITVLHDMLEPALIAHHNSAS